MGESGAALQIGRGGASGADTGQFKPVPRTLPLPQDVDAQPQGHASTLPLEYTIDLTAEHRFRRERWSAKDQEKDHRSSSDDPPTLTAPAYTDPMRTPGLILLPLLLGSCTVDLQGADFVGLQDARKYITACARSATDVYCKALLPPLERTTGEVTVILVNLGDQDRTAAIERELRAQGRTLNGFLGSAAADRFARANIFIAKVIQPGTITSLDGRTHTVTCTLNEHNTNICTIDGTVSGFNANEPGPDITGNIFTTMNILPFN